MAKPTNKQLSIDNHNLNLRVKNLSTDVTNLNKIIDEKIEHIKELMEEAKLANSSIAEVQQLKKELDVSRENLAHCIDQSWEHEKNYMKLAKAVTGEGDRSHPEYAVELAIKQRTHARRFAIASDVAKEFFDYET